MEFVFVGGDRFFFLRKISVLLTAIKILGFILAWGAKEGGFRGTDG